MTDTLTYAQRSMADFPLRTRGILAVIRALNADDNPVVSVHDGEERVNVSSDSEVLTVAHGADEATLITASGASVYLVMCNGDDVCDTIADWSLSIDPIVSPVVEKYNV